MTFAIENFEFYLFILVRITGFIYTAPFFSLKNMPNRVKVGISIFLAGIIFYTIPYEAPEYTGVIGFAVITVQEALAGAIMGLFANIAYHIIAYAGQIIDMEIGFSMVNELDPITNIQTTITSNFYGYLIMIMMLVTNMHHFFIRAIVDSFELIKVGKVVFHPNIYQLMVDFMADYFIIGFRIVLPVFAAILIVNSILGILAKIAPNMNMFVIGIQLKIFVGLVVLAMIIELIPSVADFIFNEMISMLKSSVELLR
ncbi:flagellar biosynthetic protein FliR [Lachnospiraceae bacterium MD1]|jgi:flagellar biosynthetic protein FliR|uniref:Flagellar biosynthetic protein FliR n=1 Tax=Variimorphobacter saccharofermentans TaxID=2755051 RepID=A0A839JYL5_9FIRM|nr:flagellar biosynthetic protein FliR [Variimorphobacter saccharofermentans]MBB2182755.1 flagellar biosynthetic protein FliR [Variimorphobacter saccharofermentans]